MFMVQMQFLKTFYTSQLSQASTLIGKPGTQLCLKTCQSTDEGKKFSGLLVTYKNVSETMHAGHSSFLPKSLFLISQIPVT